MSSSPATYSLFPDLHKLEHTLAPGHVVSHHMDVSSFVNKAHLPCKKGFSNQQDGTRNIGQVATSVFPQMYPSCCASDILHYILEIADCTLQNISVLSSIPQVSGFLFYLRDKFCIRNSCGSPLQVTSI